MKLTRRIRSLELRLIGKPPISPKLLALALALCEGETANL